jgi:hypothetical protein
LTGAGIIDRLLEACTTGKPCAIRPRVAAISLEGLGQLTKYELWHEAAERIVRLDAVHPAAQARFMKTWILGSFRAKVVNDDLWYTMMRKVMPPYEGGASVQRLYRGQVLGDKPGMSWARQPHIAYKFALFGQESIDPVKLATDGIPAERAALCRTDAVVLRALVPAANIICAPCLLGKAEGEYLIDPRGLNVDSEPAADTALWIGQYIGALLRATQTRHAVKNMS